MGSQKRDRWVGRREADKEIQYRLETDGKAGKRQMGRQALDRRGDRRETKREIDWQQMGRQARDM
jgi:hypothetical protein